MPFAREKQYFARKYTGKFMFRKFLHSQSACPAPSVSTFGCPFAADGCARHVCGGKTPLLERPKGLPKGGVCGYSSTCSHAKNCAAVMHFGCSISRLKKSLSPVKIMSTPDTIAAFKMGWSLASRISFSAWSTAGISS